MSAGGGKLCREPHIPTDTPADRSNCQTGGKHPSTSVRSWPNPLIMCCSSLTPRCSVGQVVHGERCPRSAETEVKQRLLGRIRAKVDPGWAATYSSTIRQGTSLSSNRIIRRVMGQNLLRMGAHAR